ncbi:MAG: methyltransferase domain-containing protein [Geminicoccaceae bacterium]
MTASPRIPTYANVPGNNYDKYGSRNPLAVKLMRGFFDSFDRMIKDVGARTAYEAGCGEGHLSLHMLRAGLQVRCSDLEPSMVALAEQRIRAAGFSARVDRRDLYTLEPEETDADVLVCCEVLEHLPEPDLAVDQLARLARERLVASVPREPIWRLLNMCRGRYLADLGNTPGHLQHWSTQRFLALLDRRFVIEDVATPLPWTMVRCKVRMPRIAAI